MPQKTCYGTIFPSISKDNPHRAAEGKVFSYETTTSGLSIPTRKLGIDHNSWENCLKCDAFESCYKLSVAQLLFHTAIANL